VRRFVAIASVDRGSMSDIALYQPVEQLSRERPLGNIFNLYVLGSVLLQFALHIVSLVYITSLSRAYEE